jgi:polysaccharide biosynthesis/export protein
VIAPHVRRLLVLCSILLLGACASTVSKLPTLPRDPGSPYLLAPGDVLLVNVFGEADLSGTYAVSDTGSIVMPLAGPVRAQGLTPDQLQRTLTTRLSACAVKSPNVTVQIKQYRPFFILGEVKNPGSYAYVPDMTVLTAVAIAGGFTFRASEGDVGVTRSMEGRPRESRASRESRVLPGDVVYVYERHL